MTSEINPYQCPKWAELLFATIQDLKNLSEDEYLEKSRANRQKLLAHPAQCNHRSCKEMCQIMCYQLRREVLGDDKIGK